MAVGIDLGTTHCALAFGNEAAIESLAIPQLVGPQEFAAEPLLPSFLYIPSPGESRALPWGERSRYIVGRYAQRRGGETLGRLVSSAKSWLSFAGVDRTAALLPLNAPEGVAKLSPVTASAEYLAHLRCAWDTAYPDSPLASQPVILTVPASFDAVARELTLRAAGEAGYPEVVLLEEPQAAFYAWIEAHPDWRERVAPGDHILVVDIGGGTTDFSLIAVRDEGGVLGLERVAVGDHILLGGDNMDLALARRAAERLPKLDPLQFQALWQQCRAAKEALLAPGEAAESYPVTVLGRGSSLVGGTLRTELRREEVAQLLLEGFLPLVDRQERPQRPRRAALGELGLPYAADARITAHLAEFLTRSHVAPTHVLFNGGVLRAAAIRQRLLEFLGIPALEGDDLLMAVARGAAYYGVARGGRGVRIRGGVSRTYYVGIETAMPAVPGAPPPLKALTVAPFGMEEGTAHAFPNQTFGLMVGEPAEFRFFSSSSRTQDAAGELLEAIPLEAEEMPPIEVVLTGEPGVVAVTLESRVTETGVLELWCIARDGRRWKLEFNVREKVMR